MIVDNLITHIATGEADNSFVGMKIIGNQIHFYYPESYHFDKNNYTRDDFLDLLKTISIAKSSSKDISQACDSRFGKSDLALLSYIWVLEDYLKNGFYINTELIMKTNQRGKINWKKTLQQQPIISGHNVIYSSLIAEVKSPRESIIVEAHRYCIKKSISLIGWLYNVSEEKIDVVTNAEKMIPRYLEAIRTELSRTFDDEKHTRLMHMENVLIGLDEVSEDNSIVYGVDSYHYVFERMIDSIFGTEKADAYYPRFNWCLNFANSNSLPGPTIRPDTIMRYGENKSIYIIDSKFYRYGTLDLSQTKGLPESASIVKQIAYGQYVQCMYRKERVYNVFILPYDAKGKNAEVINTTNRNLVCVGKVSSDWESDKSYSTIYTFLIDLRQVVKTWNRINHDVDRKNLVDLLNNEINRNKEDKANKANS